MNKQELPNQSKAEDANTNKRRHFILGVTPVVLTLVSPTVFGARCLSEQMSGNMSHNPGNNPGSCVSATGQDPAYWTAQTDWPNGYDKTAVSINTVLGSGDMSAGSALTALNPVTTTARFIAAKLNAHSVTNYILTPTQVSELWANPSSYPPGYATMDAFLESTWTY